MKFPALETSKSRGLSPILIVDKIGVFGQSLAKEFSKDFLVVLVSSRTQTEQSENIIHIPFKKKIPVVPDSNYAKIFIVDDGEDVTRKSTSSFIKKARENNSSLYFIGSIRNVDIAHADDIASSYVNSKVLIFGDLFDKNIFFDKDSAVSRFILEARKNLKIDVNGNGLNLSFPITFTDTIKLIIKASYIDVSQKTILLFCPHPITDISLANTFQKINPNITVDFIKQQKARKIYIPNGSQHAIGKYSLEEKIRDLNLEDVENREIKIAEKKKQNTRSFLKPLVLLFVICLFFLLLPLMTTSFYSFLAIKEMNSAKTLAESGDFDNALKKANNSKTFFQAAHKTSDALIFEAQAIGRRSDAQKLINNIGSGETLSQATIYLIEGGISVKQIYNGTSRNPKVDFSKASNLLKSSISLIQQVRLEGNLPKDFEQKFNNLGPFIDLFTNSSEILPDILGFNGDKTYLVLFQNNMEIRPGGGFIGSYGILIMKNGKVIDFSTNSVYQSDKKLEDHVDPPFAIRRYLPSTNFYLRDSNFDPDFVNSAISASNLYSLETKNKVDGVIGVDLSFAKNLISILGPIKVDGQNEKIDSSNFYKIFQTETEKNDSLPSLQKNDFLSQLAKSVDADFKKRKNIPFFSLAGVVGRSIKEKHLMFAFAKPSEQNVFTANGWSATLWDNRKNENGRINDYFGLSEANLGNNNVNYFVSRSVTKKLILYDNGKISSKVTIGFKNNSKPADRLGGNYKNYLRIIVPVGSKIDSVSIDGKDVQKINPVTNYFAYESKGFRPPAGLEVEETTELGKSIFGFLVNTSPAQIRTITISYTLPYSFSTAQKSIDYSLKVYKQPGIDSYPLDLIFSIPVTFRVVGGKDSYSKNLNSDWDLKLNIAQK